MISLFVMLPWKDSNPHRRNQNPTCYHYTTRQLIFAIGAVKLICRCFRFASAKLWIIFKTAKFSRHFLSKFFYKNFRIFFKYKYTKQLYPSGTLARIPYSVQKKAHDI